MFTTEEHWRHFSEFCRYEALSGGPDPQIGLVAQMSRDQGADWEETVWRAGCYIAVYIPAFAEIIWRDWAWTDICNRMQNVRAWLDSNFHRIVTRVERRCVRRPDWMAEFLLGYREFAKKLPQLQEQSRQMEPEEAYLLVWDECLKVPRLGRYVALKLLEFLEKHADFPISPPDIRPRGGWSPRSTLATLWEDPSVRVKSDSDEILQRVNSLAVDTQKRLRDEYDIKYGIFALQVVLCQYRESWEGRRQYPGRSLDSELKYAIRAEELWQQPSSIWSAREHLHPLEHLGEKQGWTGPRINMANCLADYSYTWSDLLYDYSKTEDMRSPHLREDVSAPASRIQPPKFKIWEIIPGQLYQSSRWTVLTVDQGRALAEIWGITGLLNMWKDHPNLRKMVSWYYHVGLPDGRTIPHAALADLVDAAEAHIRAGGCLVTMCHGGRNRSGMLSALIYQRLRNGTGAEAAKQVRQARRGALVNPQFLSYLSMLPADANLRAGLLF